MQPFSPLFIANQKSQFDFFFSPVLCFSRVGRRSCQSSESKRILLGDCWEKEDDEAE